MTGTRTTNISNRISLIDELVGNRAGSTGVQPFDDLSLQLLATGPLASNLAETQLAAKASVIRSSPAELNIVAAQYPIGTIGMSIVASPGLYERRAEGFVWVANLPHGIAESAAEKATQEAGLAYLERVASELAANIAAGHANTAVAAGTQNDYGLRAGFSAIVVPVGIRNAYLSGYSAPGDGGEQHVKRVASQPAAGGVRSADRFMPDGSTNASNGGWWQIAEPAEKFDVRMLGGGDDNVKDNRPAFDAFAVLYGRTGARLRLPRVTTGKYWCSGDAFNFNGIVVDPDPAVTLRGAFYFAENALKPTRLINVELETVSGGATVRYPFKISPRGLAQPEEKQQWMSGGDLERVSYREINVASSRFVKVKNDSDAYENDVSFSSSYNGASINLVADTYNHLVMRPCLGGQEINMVFTTGGNYKRLAVFDFTEGRVIVEFTGDGSDGAIIRTKVRGQAETLSTAFFWKGATDHLSYSPPRSVFTVRAVDKHTVSVLLNGAEVLGGHLRIPYIGQLSAMGFGVRSDVGSFANVSLDVWSVAIRRIAAGKADIGLLILGDSNSAPSVSDTWSEHVMRHLEYNFGSQVRSLQNNAVIGDTVGQQYDRLVQTGVGSANTAIMMLGTNNQQLGASVADTIAGIDLIYGYLRERNVSLVLMVYPLWYPKTLNFVGDGGDTFNYETGAVQRASILRYAAQKGFRCVDLTQCMPAIVAAYTNPAYGARDRLVKDNLHLSCLAYQLVGWHAASAVMSQFNPPMTPEIEETQLSAAGFANGWAHAAIPLSYVVSRDGMVTVSGNVSGGTITNGTVMYQLPRHLWPRKSMVVIAVSDTGAFVTVAISNAGSLVIYGMSAGSVVQIPPTNWQSAAYLTAF